MEAKHPPNVEHIDEDMMKVEVNLDDTPGEWMGYVMDKLFAAGANDVIYSPIYMKKNRPGILLQLLCSREKLETLRKFCWKRRRPSESVTIRLQCIGWKEDSSVWRRNGGRLR